MAAPPFESDSVTVCLLPDGISASSIRKAMARETGIAVAGAQGDYWKPAMIRIGTLGFVTESDAVRCLRALGAALAEAGHSADAVDTRSALTETSG
jgi:aspartate aminotransferase-like enzyme